MCSLCKTAGWIEKCYIALLYNVNNVMYYMSLKFKAITYIRVKCLDLNITPESMMS